MEQLLWIETLIKGSVGVCLILSPKLIVHLFGLPPSSTPFWPRLLGGVLIGLAIAAFMTGARVIDDGVGLAGFAIINLCAAALLAAHYVRPNAAGQQRGRTFAGFIAGLLTLLAALEFAAR